ncbi:hypothetical protein Avi_9557 (plasmid) [Allorhizobium ampelinum S4]|uniref:Uncharacterized protein n=1 Tax=Allorhizobium ampelinum (strain ATCC BAA-846 / DSM 112012 / S4) TaxID=311402 RepID=B9K353_ALLAM|nr:hypothetical protein Avi_9557 [Allorhizobium ampelinum S4]
MGCSFRGFLRSGSDPCRLALRCGRKEPAEDGRITGPDPLSKRSGLADKRGKTRRRTRVRFEKRGGAGRHAARSGLETTGRRFRPQQTEGRAGKGLVSTRKQRMEPGRLTNYPAGHPYKSAKRVLLVNGHHGKPLPQCCVERARETQSKAGDPLKQRPRALR